MSELNRLRESVDSLPASGERGNIGHSTGGVSI